MNLDFITALDHDGSPIPESPMAAAAAADGARLAVRGGWLVPATFDGNDAQRRALAEAVVFADASALRKTELQGEEARLSACAGGLRLGTATAHNDAWWLPLTPTRALVVGPPPDLPIDGVTAVDVTSQFCALRLQGPAVRQLMAAFCALDLRLTAAPPESLRAGSVARTPGLVIVEATQRLLVMVGAALAEYLWTVVADTAQRLGGSPVGSDLLAGEHAVIDAVAGNA